MPTRVLVRNEVRHPEAWGDGWSLWLQWVKYVHDTGDIENGYRFIWRRPDGSLQAARGQARLPSLEHVETMMRLAREQGWANHNEDDD